MWHMLGDANKVRLSEQQQKILEALTNVPQTPQQIAKATGMKIDNVRHLLRRMHADSTSTLSLCHLHIKMSFQQHTTHLANHTRGENDIMTRIRQMAGCKKSKRMEAI
jgi:hypothetical protein